MKNAHQKSCQQIGMKNAGQKSCQFQTLLQMRMIRIQPRRSDIRKTYARITWAYDHPQAQY
jgi:hypothetical protein